MTKVGLSIRLMSRLNCRKKKCHLKTRRFQLFFFSSSVVTGSTDGIGRQYAKELASQGMNIVLISRTETKLIEVSKEIGKLYKSN